MFYTSFCKYIVVYIYIMSIHTYIYIYMYIYTYVFIYLFISVIYLLFFCNYCFVTTQRFSIGQTVPHGPTTRRRVSPCFTHLLGGIKIAPGR